ncbi:MAG: hypothetical protein E2O79_08460 [Caldithrix sp.]|nr:MAG: hypothetical protein E2O79_08460 [Caldithrix sp.]
MNILILFSSNKKKSPLENKGVSMALLEMLTLGIGAGIAKGVLKIWLQDNEIALNGSEEIVELIKARPALADPAKS